MLEMEQFPRDDSPISQISGAILYGMLPNGAGTIPKGAFQLQKLCAQICAKQLLSDQ